MRKLSNFKDASRRAVGIWLLDSEISLVFGIWLLEFPAVA
jgi:hypothetical protein